MTNSNNGGPAFPFTIKWEPDGNRDDVNPGMSLRDWFAGQVLSALIAIDGAQFVSEYDDHAKQAYKQADAMLKARETRT